ncbi:ArsR/SmtB family transcription factor [Conyzicola nivalis]
MNAFKVLSHPIRFRIVEILASGEHRSGTLSDAITGNYGVSRAGVSKHLAILRNEGWIDYHGDASSRWYFLTSEVWSKIDVDVSWLKYLWERRSNYIGE